ncbi:MAG: hypothetical protein WCQ99_11675 [Pseudomonadota bacterium]
MNFIIKYLPQIFFFAAVCCFVIGLMLDAPGMMFSYAIVVCLSCIGII